MDGITVAIVLLLILFYLLLSGKIVLPPLRDRMVNMGIIDSGYGVYDSGADLRFATELTSTDQQPYATPYNKDVVALADALEGTGYSPTDVYGGSSVFDNGQGIDKTAVKVPDQKESKKERMTGHIYMCPCSKCKPEKLVGNGTFPAFWDISNQLSEYRASGLY